MKIAIISCYKDPDYVRARVLRAGLAADKRVELIVIKNKNKNVLRYPEVLCKIIWARLRQNPDVYIMTMRAEILPAVMVLGWPKPVVYDELVNFVEWFVYEHQRLKPRGEPARLLASFYSMLLRHCTFILADTTAHGAYSAALSGVHHELYRTIPIGTDEAVFKPSETAKKPSEKFEVFFYSNVLPLHGVNYVLEAAEQLRDQKHISFTVVVPEANDKQRGIHTDKKAKQAIETAITNGAHIKYKSWIPFDQLPAAMQQADLCLAGPFGNTEQAQLVITGKTYQMLACGVPTLIGKSNASGAFTDKEDCLIVPQGDSAALAAKILWAYENRTKLAAIGKNGRKLYDRKFSNEVIAKKLSNLVTELAKP